MESTVSRTASAAVLLLLAGWAMAADGPSGKANRMQTIAADDSAVLYFGAWRAPTSPEAPAGREADLPGSACVLVFRGTAVRWRGGKGPDCGLADVYLDGDLVRTVDAYAAAPAADAVLFEHGGLDEARPHRLRIVVKRERHPDAKGGAQRITAFEAAEAVNYPDEIAAKARAELALITSGRKPYLTPDRWKPAAYAARAPEGGVTLGEGPLRTAFDRNIAGLNRWFEGKEQWQRQFPARGWERHLPASSEGRMLGAAAHTLRWGERKDMRTIVDVLVGLVKDRQRPDGYCMPFPEEHMKPNTNPWFDERRNYDRVNLTRGMAAAARVGNRDALPVMRRFYDWLYASPYAAGLLAGPFDNGSAHNGNNGHEGSLLMHFSPVGTPEDLVAAERQFVQDFFLEESARAEPLSLGYYPLHVAHSYVLLAYKAWLDHYRATGAAKYLDAAKGAWRIVHDYYLHVGGTLAVCEHKAGTYPPGSYYLRVDKAHHTGETCGSVFWADVNHRFLQFFPDEARYADEIEQTIFNVILAAQDSSGNIRYHNRLTGRKDKANFQNTCCEVMASPFIAQLPQYLYSLDEEGVFVNLLAPSAITWEQGREEAALAADTDFPSSGRVLLTVGAAPARPMKVRIRVPAWAGRPLDFHVNGQVAARGKPGTYAVLDRTWKAGDAIVFELPLALRTVRYTGLDQHPDHDRYALLWGPVLMALVGPEDLAIPAADLPGRLRPIDGRPLHFRVEGHDGAHFMPYWQIDQEPFTCFPTLR